VGFCCLQTNVAQLVAGKIPSDIVQSVIVYGPTMSTPAISALPY